MSDKLTHHQKRALELLEGNRLYIDDNDKIWVGGGAVFSANGHAPIPGAARPCKDR